MFRKPHKLLQGGIEIPAVDLLPTLAKEGPASEASFAEIGHMPDVPFHWGALQPESEKHLQIIMLLSTIPL